MPRPKEFERDVVLEKAMDLFWQKGYEATSVQDLVQHMGINRGSLYDTFKDKHHLFLAAVSHYHETVVKDAIARLEAPDASRQAIVDHFDRMVDCMTGNEAQRGCLMTNTIVELAVHHPDIAAQLQMSLRRIERAFQTALTRAQANSELSSAKDVSDLARYLVCCVQGLRVMCKTHVNREQLQATVNLMLSVLDS